MPQRRTPPEQRRQAIAGSGAVPLDSRFGRDWLLTVAAHDLRAPLRGIENLAGWAAERLHADESRTSAAALHDDIRAIGEQARRLDRLLCELLDHAAGHLPSKTPLTMSELLFRAVRDAGIPPGFVVDVIEPVPQLDCPPTDLLAVLRNLIGNAARHHDRPDGRITVWAEEVGAVVRIAIQDDGPGLPWQRPPENKNGTCHADIELPPSAGGLGLAIVRHVLERCGGRLLVRSRQTRRGTCMIAEFPTAPKKAGNGADPSCSAYNAKPGKPPGSPISATSVDKAPSKALRKTSTAPD